MKILLIAMSAVLYFTTPAQAHDCKTLKPAHCFCSGGGASFNDESNCWNQSTQNGDCAKYCLGACQQGGTFFNSVKQARINAGACGTVSVPIYGHAGTRSDISQGSCSVATGGTYIAAVNPSCPSGYNFPGTYESYCVQDVGPPTPSCTAAQGWLDKASTGNGGNARCVKNSANAVSGVPIAPAWTSIGAAWNTAGPQRWVTDGSGNIWYGIPATFTCPSGYTPQNEWSAAALAAGYKPQRIVCRKTTPAIPGKAAYCKR